jgi:hypothetical protein
MKEAKMKRRILIGLLIAFGGLISWGMVELAQAQLFDLEKSRQEIQTMRGILRTTLNYALKQSQPEDDEENPAGFFGFGMAPQVSGYYLYGQGAVFTISLGSPWPFSPDPPAPPVAPVPQVAPVPPVPPAPPLWDDDDQAAIQKQTEAAKAQAALAVAQAKQLQKDAARIQEQALKQTAEMRTKMKKWREQMQTDRAKLGEQMTAAKTAMIDALAKHGDSLTVVKPQEYITTILSGNHSEYGSFSFGLVVGETSQKRLPRQILSVQKSVITDYKAGRISLDEFRKKVLSYTN